MTITVVNCLDLWLLIVELVGSGIGGEYLSLEKINHKYILYTKEHNPFLSNC